MFKEAPVALSVSLAEDFKAPDQRCLWMPGLFDSQIPAKFRTQLLLQPLHSLLDFLVCSDNQKWGHFD